MASDLTTNTENKLVELNKDSTKNSQEHFTKFDEIGSGRPLFNSKSYSDSPKTWILFDWSRLRRLYHWGPLIALFVIFYIFFITLNCLTKNWKDNHKISANPWMYLALLVFQLYLILSNYFVACFKGPGFVPYGWKPVHARDRAYLQFCVVCNGYKPPRAHHCRQCNRCVLKMDHHCPWINTCCGHVNHGYFTRFLFWVIPGCVYSLYIIMITSWEIVQTLLFNHATKNMTLPPNVTITQFFLVTTATSLSFGVTVSVSVLFIIQVFTIFFNKTAIEQCIAKKAEYRREAEDEKPFINPYNLGCCRNIFQVITLCGPTVGNGYDWPLRPGFERFYLTTEQMLQKQYKQTNSRTLIVKIPFNGNWIPFWSQGLVIGCSFPFLIESRLPLEVGEKVEVTRWRRRWLYGRLVESSFRTVSVTTFHRGWFPRRCVIEDCKKCSKCVILQSETKQD